MEITSIPHADFSHILLPKFTNTTQILTLGQSATMRIFLQEAELQDVTTERIVSPERVTTQPA
jgi:hypothetical protein